MTNLTNRVLYWTPRGLGLIFAAFLSLFALDVFDEGLGFWQSLLALAIHLIPVYVVLLVLAVAWRWEWVGTVCLASFGVYYLWFAGGRHLHWTAYVAIGGPLFLLAALFLANWLKHDEQRTGG